MANSLIIPRCSVWWGDSNLTNSHIYSSAESAIGQSLVYDVRVSIQEGGQTPSGSMKWLPTGIGYRLYETFLQESISKPITVFFSYIGGRSIAFSFVWSGQSESYGSDMSLTVKLASPLDGFVNANIKSTAQNSETGESVPSIVTKLEKSYGVERFNMVQYSDSALKNFKDPKVLSNYSEGTTFIDSVKNIAEQTGHIVTATGVVSPENPAFKGMELVVSTPFLSDTAPVEEPPLLGSINPKVRYGYFLGPGIIQTITKDSEWQPPQKTQTSVASTEQKVEPKNPGTQSQPTPTAPQSNQQQAAATARNRNGASNTSSSRSRPGARISNNEKGEKNKLDLQKERGSKLNASLFMCPALTGMKPGDVIYIPNFAGTFMEDWLVNSIEYSQTNGGVELSVQASRQYGLGNLMNSTVGKVWLEKAKAKKLVGEGSSLKAWQDYAWGSIKSNLSQVPPAPAPAATPPVPAAPPGQSGTQSSSPSAAQSSESFRLLAQPFGEGYTLINDVGVLLKIKELGFKPAREGTQVFAIPFEKAKELYYGAGN